MVDLTETSNTIFNAHPEDLSLDFEAFPELPDGKYRVFIVTVGSRGDVQPYLAFANELISRGHQVGILTHSIFRSFIKVRSPSSSSFLIIVIPLFFLFVSIKQNARSEEKDAEERKGLKDRTDQQENAPEVYFLPLKGDMAAMLNDPRFIKAFYEDSLRQLMAVSRSTRRMPDEKMN